ncbi:MAG: helix-turn-helix transcriptional regulator [Bacteroidota bacterium]
MINSHDFAKRLKIIMEYYNLSAAAFAEKIGVQRSSISHLLSGRNKPSLDFVMKIIREFDDVELYWLLNGKGTFPKSKTTPTLSYHEKNVSNNQEAEKKIISHTTNSNKTIERIVIFYKDGTFKEYLK